MNFYLGFGGIAIVSLSYLFYGHAKKSFYSYVLLKVKEELNKRLEQEDSEEMFRPAERGSSAIIRVTHGGKLHNIYVPMIVIVRIQC